jgi:hypothetical protein
VRASSVTKAFFFQIVVFFRDTFPTIYVKSILIGHYESVMIVPAGTINISRELIVALETASNCHLPMLLVTVATMGFHKLSHTTHSFIFDNESPPCLTWDGQHPESGWLLKDKFLRAFVNVYFKWDDTANYSYNFRGIYLASPNNADQ